MKRHLHAALLAVLAFVSTPTHAAVAEGYKVFLGLQTTDEYVLTPGTTQVSGSLFIVLAVGRDVAVPTGFAVTDTNANSGWQLAVTVTNTFTRASIYYCIGCTGGAGYEVTITPSAEVGMQAGFLELTGFGTSGTLGDTGTGTIADVTTIPMPSVDTTAANQVVINAFGTYGGTFDSDPIASGGAPFTLAITPPPYPPDPMVLAALSWAQPASTGAYADEFETVEAVSLASLVSATFIPSGGGGGDGVAPVLMLQDPGKGYGPHQSQQLGGLLQ